MFDYETSPKIKSPLTAVLNEEGKQVIDDFGRKMYRGTITINGTTKEIFFGAEDEPKKKNFQSGDEYMDAGRISLEGYPEAIVIHRHGEKNGKAWSMLTSNIVREDSETKAKVIINKNNAGYLQYSSDPAKRTGGNYTVTFQYDEDWAKENFGWATVTDSNDQLPF